MCPSILQQRPTLQHCNGSELQSLQTPAVDGQYAIDPLALCCLVSELHSWYLQSGITLSHNQGAESVSHQHCKRPLVFPAADCVSVSTMHVLPCMALRKLVCNAALTYGSTSIGLTTCCYAAISCCQQPAVLSHIYNLTWTS